MYPYEELKRRGREWLGNFEDVEFVGEVELPETDVDDLCLSLGRYLNRAGWDEDLRAALSVAVVNLAYYSPQELGEEGFRWLVLRRLLGHPTKDVHMWEQEVGSPVLRLLKDRFNSEDIGGAYRYVRPIMQQAGVPARLDRRFAQLVTHILGSYGHNFSDGQYNACWVEYEEHLSTAKKFLESAKGRQYCRDIARVVKNLESGLITEQDVRNLSIRLRSKVLEVWRALQNEGHPAAQKGQLPTPKLVLDRENLRLALAFSREGLGGAYRWVDGSSVRTERYVLRESDFLGSLRGQTLLANGKAEAWSVSPWLPGEDSWAAFRASDGVFEQSTGLLSPGRHLLALPDPHLIPDEYVVEECGDLFAPNAADLHVRVFDCDLPSGFELPTIGLAVRSGARAGSPHLRFADHGRQLPNANGVFVGELPGIVIENYEEGFNDLYMLVWEGGGSSRVVDEHHYRGGLLRLDIEAPSQGRIRIEPKGRTPKGFTESALDFVTLPVAELRWPDGLHEADARVKVSFGPAGRFRAEWQQSSVEAIGESEWLLPPRLDFLNGQVTFDSSVSFTVAGPVYRFELRGEPIADGVLWNDRLRERAKLHLSFSSAECNGHVELGLVDGRGFSKVLDVGPVARNRQLSVSTDDVRDAFGYRGLPAGRVTVRTRGLRVVGSDVTFLHEGLIGRCLFEDSNEEFASWAASLPEALRAAVQGARSMSRGPVPPLDVASISSPTTLRDLLHFYHACGRAIDHGELPLTIEAAGDATTVEALSWYAAARAFVGGGMKFNPAEAGRLLRHRPSGARPFLKGQGTPTTRWRKDLAGVLKALRRLKSPEDCKRMVREWSSNCRDGRWQSASGCALVKGPGGRELTQAARDYCYALDLLGDGGGGKATSYLISAKVHLLRAGEDAREGLVREIAFALESLVYYHTGHDDFGEKAREVLPSLGSHWGKFKKTLCALSGTDGDGECPPDSMALSDFSPHAADLAVEEQYG